MCSGKRLRMLLSRLQNVVRMLSTEAYWNEYTWLYKRLTSEKCNTINLFLAQLWHLVCCPLCFLQLHAQCASLLLGNLKAALQARCIYCSLLQLLHLRHGRCIIALDTNRTAPDTLQYVYWKQTLWVHFHYARQLQKTGCP